MSIFLTSSIGDNVVSALTSMNLWTAICKSIFIILLGFFLAKKGIFKEGTGKTLTKVVMTVALPCLAFTSFMSNITQETFTSAIFAFVWGFIIYILFMLLAKLLFIWEKDPTKRIVMEILFTFGSTTFFGQPLISAVFPNAFNDSNMFNVAYRVFLYSYAYIAISGDKFEKSNIGPTLKKIFLNPIIIATGLGFVLWALQLIPGSYDESSWWTIKMSNTVASFWRIDVSAPWLFQTMKTLGSLASPLVWLAIGCTLAKISFKEAASDKKAWIYCGIKLIAGPVINLLLLLLINSTMIKVTFNVVAATTLMWAVPPATVAVSYCINADKEATFASNCSLLGTLASVIFIPVYMIVLTLLQNAAIFG